MKLIILDGNYMRDEELAHSYMQVKLNMPEYYGKNLDALWDVLSSCSENLSIELINKDKLIEHLGEYGNKIISTFEEAMEENMNIEFSIEE